MTSQTKTRSPLPSGVTKFPSSRLSEVVGLFPSFFAHTSDIIMLHTRSLPWTSLSTRKSSECSPIYILRFEQGLLQDRRVVAFLLLLRLLYGLWFGVSRGRRGFFFCSRPSGKRMQFPIFSCRRCDLTPLLIQASLLLCQQMTLLHEYGFVVATPRSRRPPHRGKKAQVVVKDIMVVIGDTSRPKGNWWWRLYCLVDWLLLLQQQVRQRTRAYGQEVAHREIGTSWWNRKSVAASQVSVSTSNLLEKSQSLFSMNEPVKLRYRTILHAHQEIESLQCRGIAAVSNGSGSNSQLLLLL
jgi:hypothetical protein